MADRSPSVHRLAITAVAATVLLAGPAALAGSIRVSGTVAAPPGSSAAALSAASVQLFADDEDEAATGRRLLTSATAPAPIAIAHADADGAFSLQVSESGFYSLRLEVPGFLTLERELWPLVEDTELPPAHLVPAARSLALSLVLADGRPAAGFVIGALDGALGASPRVPRTAYSDGIDPIPWHPAQRAAVTGADGTAVLPRARGEALSLMISNHGFPQVVTMPSTTGWATLRLPAYGSEWTLAARRADGSPAANAVVHDGAWRIGLTDQDGRLAVAIPPFTAPMSLTVETPDGQIGVIAACAPGRPCERQQQITLAPPRLVAGQVLDARTQEPLAGALVIGALGPPLRCGGDGRFLLPVPVGQTSWVEAFAGGHLPLRRPWPPEGRSALSLEPAARLAGRVIDQAGAPVAGATLLASSSLSRRPGGGSSEEKTRGQEDGRFLFANLVPGEVYTVTAMADGFAPTSAVAATGDAGSATGQEPRGPGPPPAFPLPRPASALRASGPAPGLQLVLYRGSTASGRVVDPAGQPVGGAEIELEHANPAGRWTPEVYAAQAGGDGAFVVQHLPPGRFSLSVHHPGFATTVVPRIELASTSNRIDLGTVILAAGATIRGRVVDSGGRPIAGAKASLRALRQPREVSYFSAAGRALHPSGDTDQDGNFQFGDLGRDEPFDLEVTKSGYLAAWRHRVTAPTSESLRVELGAARSLRGRVVDAGRNPAAGAIVVGNYRPPLQSDPAVPGYSRSAVAEATGDFVLADLAPGWIDLRIVASGHRGGKLTTVEIPAEGPLQPLEIVLPDGASLTGKVSDEEGRPVAGVAIAAARSGSRLGSAASWEGDAGGASALADDEGRYALSGLDTGAYTVTLSAGVTGGGEEQSTAIEVTPAANHLDLVWRRGQVISGLVSDDTGLPIDEAQLTLVDAGGKTSRSTSSAADGSFRFLGVADGLYSLSATKPGYFRALASPPPAVAGQPLGGILIELSGGTATLTGKLLGVTTLQRSRLQIEAIRVGPPPDAGSELGLVNFESQARAEGFVDLAGSETRYRIPGLTPGEWRVEASIDEGLRVHGSVPIGAETRQVALDLDFGHGSTVSGQVLVNGLPLQAARVSISVLDGKLDDFGTADTGYDGHFTIGGLQAGTHDLSVNWGEDRIAHRQTLDLTGADTVEVTIALETGGISGRLTRPDGNPVAGATVQLQRLESAAHAGFAAARTETDVDGLCQVSDLEAGSYSVKVDLDGTLVAKATAEVRPREISRLDLVANPAAAASKTN
jgi:protocatechuate 3,4-dioxygenase beta subunit